MVGDVSGDRGRPSLGAVALELAVSVALYLAVEADPTTIQAWRMRGWHTARRAAWWASYRTARFAYLADRRYDKIKG